MRQGVAERRLSDGFQAPARVRSGAAGVGAAKGLCRRRLDVRGPPLTGLRTAAMERIEDEVLRDLHITASTEGGMIRVVADALEDAAIDEEAFLDRIAVESGGLR